jgi:hypothetical protein
MISRVYWRSMAKTIVASLRNALDASTCVTLTRRQKGSVLTGTRIASWAMPPPFFQGVAVKEDLRMTCSLEYCTPVLHTVRSIACGSLELPAPLTHELNS